MAAILNWAFILSTLPQLPSHSHKLRYHHHTYLCGISRLALCEYEGGGVQTAPPGILQNHAFRRINHVVPFVSYSPPDKALVMCVADALWGSE